MNLVRDVKDCCGCRTCEHVCPVHAIRMQTDPKGFLYPVIDDSICINCGLCKKKCAFQSGYRSRMQYDPCLGYAARHKDEDILMNSRSGGAFTAITDEVLRHDGVIYGAAYAPSNKEASLSDKIRALFSSSEEPDSSFDFSYVVHKRATTPEERNEFRGSKYVQTDLGDTFVQIKQDLENGKQVLFSGTGCQTGALQTYLGRDYDNLFTIDIVCHGVPSPKLWRDFLDMRERETKKKVTAVDFRDKKRFGWWQQVETIRVGNDDISSELYADIFRKDLAIRPSCTNCTYANRDRVGDITIADFWGHQKAVPGFNADNRGVSLVMVNTEKGNHMWETVGSVMDVIEVTGYPYRHGPMKRPTKMPDNYEEFWNDYLEKGYDFMMKKYCNYKVVPKPSLLQRCKNKVKKLLRKIKRRIKRELKKIKK